jgi:lactate dehydrogenase-like 2-hydroxyacid dehydrogenase
LAGAALDEIDLPGGELLTNDQVVLTPHIGYCTSEGIVSKADVCLENVASFFRGERQNIVD